MVFSAAVVCGAAAERGCFTFSFLVYYAAAAVVSASVTVVAAAPSATVSAAAFVTVAVAGVVAAAFPEFLGTRFLPTRVVCSSQRQQSRCAFPLTKYRMS